VLRRGCLCRSCVIASDVLSPALQDRPAERFDRGRSWRGARPSPTGKRGSRARLCWSRLRGVDSRIAAKGAVRDDCGVQSARGSTGLSRHVLAATKCGCLSGITPGEISKREGSRAALPERSRRLARSAKPDLLLPRPETVRRNAKRGVRLSRRGKGRSDEERSRYAMNPMSHNRRSSA